MSTSLHTLTANGTALEQSQVGENGAAADASLEPKEPELEENAEEKEPKEKPQSVVRFL